MPQVPGVCNSYVPSNSVIDRFLYVVNYMTQQGMYVVMDNQLNLDRSALDNPNSWASQVGAVCLLFLGSQSGSVAGVFSSVGCCQLDGSDAVCLLFLGPQSGSVAGVFSSVGCCQLDGSWAARAC